MNKRARGYLITIFASIAWGFSGVCSEFLMKEYHADPYWLTAIRMLLAAPTTMLFLLFKDRGISELHKQLLHNRRSYLPMVTYSVFGLAASQLTYVVAIGYSNAGTATVIEFLGPILIVLFVCITARRLPKYTELFAIIFALFGTFILATHGKIDSLVISTQALNWGLASAIGFALYTLIPVKLIRRCLRIHHRWHHLGTHRAGMELLHHLGSHVDPCHGRFGHHRDNLRLQLVLARSRRYRSGACKPHFLPSTNLGSFLLFPPCRHALHAARYFRNGPHPCGRYYCQSQRSNIFEAVK